MLTNMNDILIKAKLNNKAIYQFNINNLEWIKFILKACNEEQQPVILGVSESSVKYMCGYKNVVSMVESVIDFLNINIPVSIHLDHASSYESIKNAIDCGFTSVMLDYSAYSLDENISMTKKVVAYAKERNVLVEGEIGIIGENSYPKLEDCIKYVEETNIDIFAPAIGNLHGIYKGPINLNFDLLKEIEHNIKKPLVLHGASGLSNDMLIHSVELGISKINVNTDLQLAWSTALRKKINLNEEVYDPRKIISYGEEEIVNVIKSKLSIFR